MNAIKWHLHIKCILHLQKMSVEGDVKIHPTNFHSETYDEYTIDFTESHRDESHGKIIK